jgi:hypothetical protein
MVMRLDPVEQKRLLALLLSQANLTTDQLSQPPGPAVDEEKPD